MLPHFRRARTPMCQSQGFDYGHAVKISKFVNSNWRLSSKLRHLKHFLVEIRRFTAHNFGGSSVISGALREILVYILFIYL